MPPNDNPKEISRQEKNRIVIFARVSTGDQHTIPAQIQDITNHLQKQDVTIIEIIEEKKSVKADEKEFDITAYLKRIPGLKRIVDLAEQKQYNTLYVWRWDRLARKLAFQELICSMLSANNVKAISYMEGDDIFRRQISGGMAEEENRIKSARVKTGMKISFEQLIPQNKPPIGYKGIRKRRGKKLVITKWIPDKHAQEVKDIFQKWISGTKLNHLAKEYKTSKERIIYVLKNESYLGFIKYNDQLVKTHEPIITKEMFDNSHKRFEEQLLKTHHPKALKKKVELLERIEKEKTKGIVT